MPPGDDEVTIRGLFEDAISPELERTARSARETARALTETGAGGEAAAVGMDRASIAAGRLKHELEGVDRATEQHRLAQLRLLAAESEATKIRSKGVLSAQESARVEGMLTSARNDAARAANGLREAHVALDRATENLGMRMLRTAGSVGFLTKAFQGLKMLATVDVFTSLIGGVSSLGAAGIAAVAGLAPLLGTAGALPALGLAAVSAFAGVSLLAGGVMSAVKAMQTAGPSSLQAQQALNRLGPSSAAAAYDVYGLTFSLRDMREEAMRTALPYLEHSIGNVRTLLPSLRSGFVGVTQAVAQTASDATDRMVGASSDIDLILQRNAILVRTLGGAVVDTLDAGRHIMVGAGPMVQHFAERFAGEMNRVNESLAANPGKIEAYFDRVFDRAMAIIHVLSDFGHGFLSILHGATPLSDHMGAGIQQAASNFRAWAASAGGQNSIHKFFTDAIPVVDSMVHLLGEAGKSLSTLSRSGNTAGMINALADVLPPLTKLLELIEKVASVVPGGNSALAMLFIANRVGLSPSMLGQGTFGAGRGAFRFAGGLRGAEGASESFAGRTGLRLAGRLGIGAAAAGGGEAAAGIGAAAGGEGALAGGAGLLAAIPVVGWIIAAVVALGVAGYELYKHWKPFHDLIDKIGRGIADAFGWVVHHAPQIGRILLMAFAPIAWPVKLLLDHWHGIEHTIASIVGHMVALVQHTKDFANHLPGAGLVKGAAHLLGGFLATGGPVAPNVPYVVGERGPELFATAGTMRVVGGDGAELMRSPTAGFVLPNEALRAIESLSVRQAASRAFPAAEPIVAAVVGAGVATGTGTLTAPLTAADLPPIVIGPVYTTDGVDLELAVANGIERWFRERRDRR